MDSSRYSACEITSVLTAEGPAVAQQAMFGQGGNLDNQVLALPRASDTRVAPQPNGFCALQLFGAVGHETLRSLGPWRTLREYVQCAIDNKIPINEGATFSVQMGGKWASKINFPHSKNESFHIVSGGAFSAVDILTNKMLLPLHAGGVHSFSYFLSSLLSYISFSVFRFIFFASYRLPGQFFVQDFSNRGTCERVTPTLLTRIFLSGKSGSKLLPYYTSCIPLALYESNLITFSQAIRLAYVTKASDLPKPLLDSLKRSKHGKLLFRKYHGHIESSLRPITSHNYTLFTLKEFLDCNETFLATPYTDKEATPSMELTSPTLPMLGGVRSVLTQLATSFRAPTLNERWHPTLFPRQATQIQNLYEFARHRVNVLRENNYIRSFPENISVPQQPEHFQDSSKTTILAREGPNPARAHSVTCQYNRNWMKQPINDRVLEQTHAGLANILEGSDYTRASLQAAEQAIAMNRFLDTRGNKTVPRWEADAWNRWSGLTNLYQVGRSDRSYFQIAFRLLSRYYAAQVQQQFPQSVLAPVQLGTNTLLTPLTAQLPPLVPGQPIPVVNNPELALHAPGALEGLRDGSKQFIDAEGLAEGELRELISAVVPSTPENRLRFTIPDAQQQPEHYFSGPTRYYYPNDVNEVFIHFGNNPIPAYFPGLAATIHDTPNSAYILSVLRYLLMRHGAAKDINDAMELLVSRIALYSSAFGLQGLRPNAPNEEYIHADGHYELHLPRDKTASGYFDSFFVPVFDSSNLAYFASYSPQELINQGVLFNNARATALNWAATAWSMTGRTWTNPPGRENNPYVRNHIDVWLRRYSSDILNLWSSCHNNAFALQYGFGVDARIRGTEAGFVVNWWQDYQAPYLVNPYHDLWLAEKLPSHQTLPYDDPSSASTVSWPSGTPFPISDLYSFSQNLKVELARDLPPEVARSWMADGGPTVNAQHYVAVGRPAGFRYENGGNSPRIQIARWRQRHPYQFPQAPANQNITWMAPGGTPFADFLLPGSLPTVNLEQNIAYVHGLQPLDAAPAAEKRYLSQLWFDTARQVPKRSLMINYVSPFPDRREFSSLQDYSIVVWEKQNAYAGMSLIPVDFSPQSIADYHPNPQLPMPNVTRPSANDISDVTKGRVARTKPRVAPRVKASAITDRLREYHAPPRSDDPATTGTQGVLNYASKYPVEQSEVPELKGYVANVNGPKISIREEDTGAFNRLQKQEMLHALQTNMQLMAKLQASPLLADPDSEALIQESAQRRAAYEAQQARVAQRAKAPSPTRPRGRRRSSPPPTHLKTPSNTQGSITYPVKGRLNKEVIEHEPVEVNDAPAVDVQDRAMQFARPIDRASGSNAFPNVYASKGNRRASSLPSAHGMQEEELDVYPEINTYDFPTNAKDSLNATPVDGNQVSKLAEN